MKLRITHYFSIIGFIFLMSCGNSTPDFYYTENGLKYKYHDISDGATPKIGDFLTVNLQFKNENDSVFYNSHLMNSKGVDVIKLGTASVKGGIEEGFAKLKVGDSVTFYINAKLFFNNYQQKNVPLYLKPDSEMQITLRLIQIEDAKTYRTRIEEELINAEIAELVALDAEVEKWKAVYDTVYEYGGIFMVSDQYCDTSERFSYQEKVLVRYKGSYLNGKTFYNNLDAEFGDEYMVGVKGQNIEGMKVALYHMCHGQKVKVLVPSMLGFSEGAVEMGIVPAYEPLILELEVE